MSTSPRTTIILVHGGALSGRMFKDVVPLLASYGYQILTPDLPGHGNSVALGPFTFSKSTEFLHSEIEKIKAQQSGRLVLVGVSLGGQAVLDLLVHHPSIADAALVSGVSINPPSESAAWEMPHMPTSEEWTKIMMEDVEKVGMEAATSIQAESFAFTFDPPQNLPPAIVMIGEHDVAMAKRDFDELYEKMKKTNEKSQQTILKDAWHNHPIDVPDVFADAIRSWAETCFPPAQHQ